MHGIMASHRPTNSIVMDNGRDAIVTDYNPENPDEYISRVV